MPRNLLRVISVLVLLVLASAVPYISSGYSELKRAGHASSYAEAAAHYQAAAQRLPWRADLYELAGHAYYHAREYTKAAQAYQTAFSHTALSPAGWMAWGDVYYLSDNLPRATEIWEKALEQPDPSDQLYSRLAQIYQANGEHSKAAEYFRKYVSLHPEDASTHYRLGLLLVLSDPEGASKELLSAAQLDPQFDPAVQTLRTALNLAALNDSRAEASVILGRGLALVNEWALARAAFETAVEMDPNEAEAWAWLGEAKQQTGAEGSPELDRALALGPNSPAVRGLRGLRLQRVGNYREALTEFQAAAALEPDNPAWLVSIGETYSKLGDLIRALQSYQAATVLAPQDAHYWRLLAIFCAQNDINIPDVGLPAAQKVVILGQVDSNSLDLVGWLLTLAARYDEAERMLERALELDPQNGMAHLHLGMLYLQTGQRARAYEHLVRARDLGNEEAKALLSQYFP